MVAVITLSSFRSHGFFASLAEGIEMPKNSQPGFVIESLIPAFSGLRFHVTNFHGRGRVVGFFGMGLPPSAGAVLKNPWDFLQMIPKFPFGLVQKRERASVTRACDTGKLRVGRGYIGGNVHPNFENSPTFPALYREIHRGIVPR